MSNHQELYEYKKGLATYRRLLGYVRPYLSRLFIGIFFGILFAGSTTGLLGAARNVLTDVFEHASFHTVVLVGVLLLIFALGRGVGQFLSEYFIQWVGNRVVMDLRIQTFAHLQELSVRYFTKSKTGELISRTINDSMMVERAVSAVLGDLVKQPFVLIGVLGYLFWLDSWLAFLSLILFPICILPVTLFGRRVRRYARHGQEHLAALVTLLQEDLVGIRIVKAFGMERYEIDRFTSQCQHFFSRIIRVVMAKACVEPIIVFLSMFGLSLVLLYARWSEMPAPDFITFAIGMLVLYEPVKKISRIHLNIQQTSASADRIFEIIDVPALVCDLPNAVVFKNDVETLKFDNVNFAYDDALVLNEINFTVRAGERVAIVGGSGVGKTTLVNLLPRFYDVTSGALLLNGVDVRRFTLKSLRQQIGMVTQDTILFNDTVANNIAYGHFNVLRQDIEEAARRANACEFIDQMPEGYDTVIGERGVRMSGGQCQRIAIARAILRNPPILILDEATSALDTESERLVQTALDQLMEGRTVFAIAHRLSTIIHSNMIVVLDKGRIVEFGAHQELLDRNGIYRRLYDMQFSLHPGVAVDTNK